MSVSGTSSLPNGPINSNTSVVSLSSSMDDSSANAGNVSSIMVDDMFLSLENAFGDDFEKIKRIANEVQQFCTNAAAAAANAAVNNSNDFGGANEFVMQITANDLTASSLNPSNNAALPIAGNQLTILHNAVVSNSATPAHNAICNRGRNLLAGPLTAAQGRSNAMIQSHPNQGKPEASIGGSANSAPRAMNTTNKGNKRCKRTINLSHGNNNNSNGGNNISNHHDNNNNNNDNNYNNNNISNNPLNKVPPKIHHLNLNRTGGSTLSSNTNSSSNSTTNSPTHCNGVAGGAAGTFGNLTNSTPTTPTAVNDNNANKSNNSNHSGNLSAGAATTANNTSVTATGQRKERSLHYCSICSKGFKDKYSVNVHIRTHTGEKPFACTLCGKSFRQKAHLAKHYQTHMAQKNNGQITKGNGGKHHRNNNSNVVANVVAAGAQSTLHHPTTPQQQRSMTLNVNSNAANNLALSISGGGAVSANSGGGLLNNPVLSMGSATSNPGHNSNVVNTTILPPATGLLANR